MTDAFHRAESGGFVFLQPGTPLTPAQTDAFLQYLNNELETSGESVRTARKALAKCQKAYGKKKTRLLMSDDCPRVGRTTDAVTAAERDAWVQQRADDEWEAMNDAEVLLENAIGYAWQVKDQVSLAQSLNNNATAGLSSFRGGGR